MRRVVVSVLTSLDGYVEGPGGDLAPMPFDDGFSPHNLELLERAQTMLLGRTGYEGFAAYWPGRDLDESEPPVERAIARRNTAMEKLVVSDTLRVDPGAAWASTVRVVPRAEAAKEIDRLRHGDGGDIVVFGSATTWNPLLERGLVDELQVLVGPALLGGGTPVFTGSRVALRLLGAERLPESQLVLLRYAPA